MDSKFTPRKEFLRDQSRTTNNFCLLALSGTSFIRLYSFPKPLVAALRQVFDVRGIVSAFREDVALNFVEFNLDGKPWASAKSVHTEKLLMDIVALVYSHGFSFLSTIDYGRETDDRLVMVFSSPAPSQVGVSSNGNGSASSPFGSPNLANGSGSTVSIPGTGKRVPFALSFPSKDILRVVNPPLHLTPAILQGVRGSWPRGIVSEKKIGESTYEFKLKGYKWYHEDTFATDSLRHILSLLASLDQHAFCLLTSVSLTGRSRIKDLWIFTGPAPSDGADVVFPDSPAASIFTGDIKRANPTTPEPPRYTQHGGGHRKLASSPGPMSPQQMPTPTHHARAATDGPASPVSPGFPVPNFQPSPLGHGPPPLHPSQQHMNWHPPPPQHPTIQHSPSLLRKAAPRAQVPLSVALEPGHDNPHVYRTVLPSVISNDGDNMTGIGSSAQRRDPTVFYSSTPEKVSSPPHTPISDRFASSRPSSPKYPEEKKTSQSGSSDGHSHVPLTAAAAAVAGGAAVVHHADAKDTNSEQTSPQQQYPTASPNEYPAHVQPQLVHSRSVTPPLLGPGAFRDSAVSSQRSSNAGVTDSCEIPISWTGLHGGNQDTVYKDASSAPVEGGDGPPSAFRAAVDNHQGNRTSMPMIPGGWAPTPIEEKPGNEAFENEPQVASTSPVEHNHDASTARVAELTHPGGGARKSEAAFIGVMPSNKTPPPLPQTSAYTKEEKGKGREVGEAPTMEISPVVLDPSAPISPPVDGTQSPGGWVLVSVAGQTPDDAATKDARDSGVQENNASAMPIPTPGNLNPTSGAESPEPLNLAPGTPIQGSFPLPPNDALPPSSSMSGAVKAIAVLDAVDSKTKSNAGNAKNPSKIRRFFSKSSKRKATEDSSADETGSVIKGPKSTLKSRK